MSEVATEVWIPEETFADRLAIIRRHLGLSQAEAAQRCGFTKSRWSKWERGASPQKMDDVATRIKQCLGVDRGWLMWGLSTSGYMLTGLPADPGQLELAFLPPPVLVAT